MSHRHSINALDRAMKKRKEESIYLMRDIIVFCKLLATPANGSAQTLCLECQSMLILSLFVPLVPYYATCKENDAPDTPIQPCSHERQSKSFFTSLSKVVNECL